MPELNAASSRTTDEDIRRRAIARVAEVFGKPAEEIAPEMAWGAELKGSVASDWRENQYDKLLEDVLYVADQRIRKELHSGARSIQTVGDYCDHMVRCYATRPSQVADVLGLTRREAGSFVRSFLKRLGF